jgi:hypothetical protein
MEKLNLVNVEVFVRIHLEKVYQSHRRKPKKAKFVAPTRRWRLPPKPTSPACHGRSRGSGKEKEVPRNSLARRHQSYSALMFSLATRHPKSKC